LLAGVLGGPGNLDGVGAEARMEQARSIALDTDGNIYVSDSSITLVRRVTNAGVVTTLIGQAAKDAMPVVLARDAAGNIYAADKSNHTIIKTTPSGVRTIFAGAPGVIGYADGVGAAAQFHGPAGVVLDTNDNIYVADDGNNTIREITPGGAVTTLAGKALYSDTVDGTGQNARFTGVAAIVMDKSGMMYVTGYDYTVRKVANDGTVTTLAGSKGLRGIDDGAGASARFSSNYLPLAIDTSGNLYTSDNTTVRKITSTGTVSTLAGAGRHYGQVDGKGAAARFGGEFASLAKVVAGDTSGNIYVQEPDSIRQVTPEGLATTVLRHGDNQVRAFATDANGNLYAQCPVIQTTWAPNAVCMITPAGLMTLFPGTTGLHANVLAADPNNNVYAVDFDNLSVRKFEPTGQSSTLLTAANLPGSGKYCSNFDNITADAVGNVFVSNNQQIFRIGTDGTVSLLAGWADQSCFWVGPTTDNSGMKDGLGSTARFVKIGAMTTDREGNLYVVDNNTIRKITPVGLVSTIIGQPDSWGVRLGPLPGSLYNPNGLVFLPGGESPRLATIDENAVLLIGLP